MDTEERHIPAEVSVSDETRELDEKLALAEDLTVEEHFDDSIAVLRETIERFPQSPLPHHALAVVYLTLLRRDYEHEEIWENLADDEAYFELAVAEEEAALELDENFIPARNNLGSLFAYRGWWDSALRQWEISLAIAPDQPMVRDDLARVRERME